MTVSRNSHWQADPTWDKQAVDTFVHHPPQKARIREDIDTELLMYCPAARCDSHPDKDDKSASHPVPRHFDTFHQDKLPIK